MIAEIEPLKQIECPACECIFPRPHQISTATCPSCYSCITLVDQVLENRIVIKGAVVTRGKIFVKRNGSIKGDLSATEMTIEGSVEGNVTVIEKLTLAAGSRLYGNIRAGSLDIHKGAKWSGLLEIGGSNSKSKKPDHGQVQTEDPDRNG